MTTGVKAMKLSRTLLVVCGALLLVSATESRALPPRQHATSGVIKSIDHDTHTITLTPDKGGMPLVFVWKNHTRFSQGWRRICLGAIEAGHAVRISYRREMGQLVPREVSLRNGLPTRCATGKRCAGRGANDKDGTKELS